MSLAPSFEPVLPQTDVPSQTWLAPEAETAETPANPLAGLFRAMRARWGMWLGMSVVLGGALGTVGFLYGTKIYQSEAILRAYPTASGILYDSDDSVLKTFTAFVKAETSAVASHEVMQRATEALRIDFPVLTEDMTSKDLRGSVEIKRSESLIVLKTASKTPAFAAAKLDAISSAYLGLKAERQTERMRSRGAELTRRETELLARLQDIDAAILEAGGEFGVNAISKAHIEKIAQIDALAVRQSEVSRTLEALSASENVASADMNDKDIIRATLLDRGLADLNIELARREAELQVMLLRYTETARPVQDKTNPDPGPDRRADRSVRRQIRRESGCHSGPAGQSHRRAGNRAQSSARPERSPGRAGFPRRRARRDPRYAGQDPCRAGHHSGRKPG
jgi:succinoglycan biosynthesis transport protein ExoP